MPNKKNGADPYDHDSTMTLKDANEDRNVYLITDEDGENLEKWISLNYNALFEHELNDCYTDKSLWPQKRNKKIFNEWFSVECHSTIIDTVDIPIENYET